MNTRLNLRRVAHPPLCDIAACREESQVHYQSSAASCRARDWNRGAWLCDEHHATLLREDAKNEPTHTNEGERT